MKCEWCGEETTQELVYVMVGATRTLPDGKVQDPAEFRVCGDCMNLAANNEWDKLTEKMGDK